LERILRNLVRLSNLGDNAQEKKTLWEIKKREGGGRGNSEERSCRHDSQNKHERIEIQGRHDLNRAGMEHRPPSPS